MANKGDILVNAWTTTDYMINPSRTMERFSWNIGIVRTLRRNGDASKYDSFQGQYGWEEPQIMRSVPGANCFIVPRSMFGTMTDDQIANWMGAQDYKSLDDIRNRVRAAVLYYPEAKVA